MCFQSRLPLEFHTSSRVKGSPAPLAGIGSRGTLYLDAGGSYQAPGAHVATWGGRAEVHRAQPVAKSGFMQRLEEEAEGAEEEEGHAGGAALQDQV